MSKNYSLILIFILTLTTCSSEEPTVWQRAAKFVKYHSSENYLNHVDPVFKMTEGIHTVSDWQEYFFSPLSTRNWLGEEDEYAAYSREPVIPRGIVLRSGNRDTSVNGNQLVISVDKASNTIMVKGYEKDNENPAFEDKWKFPELK